MRNHEGYKDTTAGKAIRKVDRERRKKKRRYGTLNVSLRGSPGFSRTKERYACRSIKP